MDRLKQLEQFYSEDPEDPFTLYALALEWSKTNPQKGINLLQQLRVQQPDYVPTYYQLALLLLAANLIDDASIVIREGIEAAMKLKDNKSAVELRSLLEEY